MQALNIQNLSKVYKGGTQALKNVSLTVEAGDFFALLGANGAGKTTLIGILTGLVIKTAGQVKIFGHDIERDHAAAKRLIGVVPQEFNFNIFERVEDILITQAGYYGFERKRIAKEVEEILKRLGLWEKRFSSARTLSGGMKRRLMIARALIHKPKFLILDEPTAGVDVELRYEMWEYLRQLNKDGLTILLTTHYLEEVEQMCRTAAIIKNGEIIRQDEVRKLVRLIDKETFTVVVQEIKNLDKLKEFNPVVIDQSTFEVDLNQNETALHDFIVNMAESGMIMLELRPKGHRLEKLFLKILKEK